MGQGKTLSWLHLRAISQCVHHPLTQKVVPQKGRGKKATLDVASAPTKHATPGF